MEQRAFGNTGLKVSVLGLGASHIGNQHVSEEEAGRFLNEALDLGVTLVDTARGYGLSEERIGRHIAHRRSEYVLSSKCGYSIPGTEDWTPECIHEGIARALSVMRTDYIDIMHFHSCPLDTLKREGVIAALLRAVDEGKVRVAAYSGDNEPRQYAVHSGQFGAIQTSINICDQRVIDEALPLCREHGLGVIAKRPIANAFWRFADRPTGDYSEVYWDRAKGMGLAPGDLSWPDFALRFTAFQPGVHSCIVGTANIKHFRDNLEIVAKGPLPADLIDSTRRLFHQYGKDWEGQV